MSYPLDVAVTAPFDVGDITAEVQAEDGRVTALVLRGGMIRATLPARPTQLRLTLEPAPPSEDPLRVSTGGAAGTPSGDVVEAHVLFGEGVPIPPDGRVTIHDSPSCGRRRRGNEAGTTSG